MHPRPLWAEPSFREALGSCVFSLAVVIGLTTDDRRLISPVVSRTDTHADSLTSGKEKARARKRATARDRRVQELGASEASIGGRAQWVKRSERASKRKRDCGSGRGRGCGRGKECSPSAGWRETAHTMHATEGASHR